MRDRTFSQCEIVGGEVEGVFLSMNNTTRWSFYLHYDPNREDPERWDDAKVVAKLRAVIGGGITPRLLHRGTWVADTRVAKRYREGRVVLVGDAAHIMPPWGGMNGNTGIADALSIAWRLAGALKHGSDHTALDAYEAERLPVARRNGEQALLRDDFELRFGIRLDANSGDFDRLRDGGELLMRYRYGVGDTVDRLAAQIGTRFPHAWVAIDGKRRSILDLFGDGTVTIGGPAAEAECGIQAGRDFRLLDGLQWSDLVAGTDNSSIQVRPDGIVSGRGSAGSRRAKVLDYS